MNTLLLAMDMRLTTFPPLFPARVVSWHRHVVNLAPAAAADTLFSLADEHVPRAPRQLRCAHLQPVVDGQVMLSLHNLPPLFDCTLRFSDAELDGAALEKAWEVLMAAAAPAPDAFAAIMQNRLQQGITALLNALDKAENNLPLAGLVGLGMGLTPSGDDFLSGLLIALHLPQSPFAAYLPALRAQVLAHLAATHAVSAAFLCDAAQAQISEPVQSFVDALFGRQALASALAALTALGHRSGFDFLSGLLAGLPHCNHRRIHLCPYIAV